MKLYIFIILFLTLSGCSKSQPSLQQLEQAAPPVNDQTCNSQKMREYVKTLPKNVMENWGSECLRRTPITLSPTTGGKVFSY